MAHHAHEVVARQQCRVATRPLDQQSLVCLLAFVRQQSFQRLGSFLKLRPHLLVRRQAFAGHRRILHGSFFSERRAVRPGCLAPQCRVSLIPRFRQHLVGTVTRYRDHRARAVLSAHIPLADFRVRTLTLEEEALIRLLPLAGVWAGRIGH